MVERGRRRRRPAPRPARDGSRRPAAFRPPRGAPGATSAAVTAAGLLAALLLVGTELTTLAAVELASGSCELLNDSDPELADRCELSGLERHGGAFALLGLLAAALALAAGLRGSHPAAVALVAIGVVVLAWSLALDLPVTSDTGTLGRRFEAATARPGPAFWFGLAGGALAAAAGTARLARG